MKYMKNLLVETYLKKRTDSLPSHFSDAINELKNEGKIKEDIINKYCSVIKPDTSILSCEELQVIGDN